MRMVNKAAINGKNVFIVCHRVKYTLFGEQETRFINRGVKPLALAMGI